MIDMHSHIIPGIDDGSKNINMTLDMLREAVENGTKKIVATPHYCRGFAEVHYDEVKKYVEKLNLLVSKENIDIEVICGQEVYYSNRIIDDYNEGIIGTINDSRYMLIETSMGEFDDDMIDVLYELQIIGVNIILAHPERYKPIIDDPSIINTFIKEGYLFQLNVGSITGDFGNDVKRTAEILLENNIYSFIGSDAHNLVSRTTDMSEGISILKSEYEQNIDKFLDNSNNVIENKAVSFDGELIRETKRKRKFRLFW